MFVTRGRKSNPRTIQGIKCSWGIRPSNFFFSEAFLCSPRYCSPCILWTYSNNPYSEHFTRGFGCSSLYNPTILVAFPFGTFTLLVASPGPLLSLLPFHSHLHIAQLSLFSQMSLPLTVLSLLSIINTLLYCN